MAFDGIKSLFKGAANGLQRLKFNAWTLGAQGAEIFEKSAETLQLERMNPLRGVDEWRLGQIFDDARDGIFADLAWLYNEIEGVEPALAACCEMRESAASECGWIVKTADADRTRGFDAKLADEQRIALLSEFGAVEDDLADLASHLVSAFFRGAAHALPLWNADGSASTSLSPTTVNGVEYNTVTLRFDSQNMPQFRTQNTSWLVSVTKSVSEVRQWNVTLLNPDKVSTDISFYDELNANKTTYERQSLLHKTITANTTVEVPYAAAAASVIVRFMNWDGTDQIYQTMADWENDYDLVVKVDGQDISDEFTDTGEYAFIANNLDPELLSATDWIVGFKEKTSTAVTHTAMLTGNIGSNQVTMQWENAQGQALSSYTVSSATPNATSTSTAQPASCRATVKLQDGYSFKAYFNGQELPAFTKSADDTYTSSFDWAVSTDGSWIFEFTKKPAEIIEFADAKVKSICVANWDTDGDGELSKVEAAAVTTLMDESNNPLFLEKASMPNKITSFNELQYFTGLTKIEEQAFMGCTKLVSIILPKTITEIDANAFNNCALLTQIVLPEGVEKIESGAFRFSGLVNIYIPKSVTTIGSSLFGNKLVSIVVADKNETYDSRNGCNAIIRTSDNTLIAGCKSTVIPSDITTIGPSAFSFNSGLTEIVIPASVSSFKTSPFHNCQKLTSVICKWDVPPFNLSNQSFSGISDDCVLTVPNGTKDAYIAKDWTESVFKGGVVEAPSEYDLNKDNKVTITDAVRMLDVILEGQGKD